MDNYKIISTNYALASAYSTDDGNFIEINHKLVGSLREKIIKHETRHKANRHYTKEDLMNDFQSENSYFMESFKFAIFNPECLIGFFPLMFSYYFRKLTINIGALIPFVYFGLIASFVSALFFKYILKTPFLSTFLYSALTYILLFALLNGILLFITHREVKKQKNFEYKEVIA